MVDIRGTNVKASTAGDSGIACSEGEDVGAGDGAGAGCFEGGLDLVDHLETPEGVQATLQEGWFGAEDSEMRRGRAAWVVRVIDQINWEF
uniref:Uncharacterized protein n=1 Tax=Oryza meridionalis TaxID=40149 RepID=A0A0E0C0A6_9ORYZ